jgi:hypothetical protein
MQTNLSSQFFDLDIENSLRRGALAKYEPSMYRQLDLQACTVQSRNSRPLGLYYTEPELKKQFLGLSAFSRGGDRRSQIRKKNIGVARFHRLRIFTWAL